LPRASSGADSTKTSPAQRLAVCLGQSQNKSHARALRDLSCTMTRALTHTVATACALALFQLSGCTADGNQLNTLGEKQSVATSARAAMLPTLVEAQSRNETPVRSDPASLTGPSRLARADWQATTFLVPVDGTDAYPTYSRHTPIANATARQRGDFPVPMSALELEGDTTWQRRREVLRAPFDAAWQAAAIVPRFFFVEPWQETRHRPTSFWVAPGTTQRVATEELIHLHEPVTDSAEPAGTPTAK
jgi:hypothetical protein